MKKIVTEKRLRYHFSETKTKKVKVGTQKINKLLSNPQ